MELLGSLPRGMLIDTAEKYGTNDGEAKRLLCSKFTPKPWRLTPDSIVEACKALAERLGVYNLYLCHLHHSDAISQPFELFGYLNTNVEIYWEGLTRYYHESLVKLVGVYNYGPQNVRVAYDFLSKRKVPLAYSNQFQSDAI